MKMKSKDTEKNLTIKQRKFLKLYFETGNGTLSAMQAYDCKDVGTAANIASENLRKLQNPIKTYLEANGLSIGKLKETLNEGLKANRVISAMVTDKEAKGNTTDFIEVPDHQVRHKYMETGAKWLGITNDQPTVEVNQQTNNLSFSDEQLARLME